MPDLDQLLDTLVADVNARTRAPGASAAVKQAHQRRRTVAVAAAAAVTSIAVAGGLAAGSMGGNDRSAPIGEPTPAGPESPVASGTATASPVSSEVFAAEVRRTLGAVPEWAATGTSAMVFGSCEGNWAGDAGGSGGSFGISSAGQPPYVWHNTNYFRSPAEATRGSTRLVEQLTSCTQVEWRTQPVGETGAVLASSDEGVAWIHQKGATVSTLQVPTTDGPPPAEIQLEVADLIRASTR